MAAAPSLAELLDGHITLDVECFDRLYLNCDFFTVETIRLKTIYVLFFIELSTRRVHVAVVTASPDSAWVTQQGRNLAFAMQDGDRPIRSLLRDRDSKYSRPFDEVFRTEGVRVIQTPFRAPNANAFAEGAGWPPPAQSASTGFSFGVDDILSVCSIPTSGTTTRP
jgi:hypothetical protein